MYDETYRPQFHFTPLKNWTNDPNGLVFYRGEYHLFFQHNPHGINWGNMTWGHAVSPDLVHWRQLSDAIEPDPLGTIFSGSAVVDWHNTTGFQTGEEKPLVAIYTAAGGTSEQSQGQPFTQCLAYSNDRGRTWTKYAGNPVLGHIVKENRDPKVVWHAPTRRWIMALFKDGNTYAFFSSPDLKRWTHLHDMDAPGCGECPDFFEMPVEDGGADTRWVWTAANGHYLVGTFDGARFAPESGPHVADHGANYYAVQTYSDIPASDGRRIQIAWMAGGQYPDMPFNQQMSFPCELRLRSLPEGLRLCRTPAKEIESLYAGEHVWRDLALQPSDKPASILSGDLFDIHAEFDLGDAAEVGFRVRGEPIVYSAKDRTISCLGKSAELAPEDGRVSLRVLVDRASLEVFSGDGRLSMTSCFLPRPESREIELHCAGGSARIISLRAHELKSSWAASFDDDGETGKRREEAG